MSLGGRPKKEGGHKRFHVSFNKETREGLAKIRKEGKPISQFIENAVGPLIRQYDPGDSCEALNEIDCLLECKISSAVSRHDFEKVSALTAIGNALDPFRRLCRPTKGDTSENGKRWVKQCSCKNLQRKSEASNIWLREIAGWQKSDLGKQF